MKSKSVNKVIVSGNTFPHTTLFRSRDECPLSKASRRASLTCNNPDSSPPALSSFGEERENYFAGRFPGVAAARPRRANFRSAFSALEFATIRDNSCQKIFAWFVSFAVETKKRPLPPCGKGHLVFLQFDFTDAVARAAAWAGSGWRGSRHRIRKIKLQ